MSQESPSVRRPVVAGQFYTANPSELRGQVLAYLAAGEPAEAKHTLLAMVPHAGYVYSGIVAGKTLGRASLGETVVLLGPNHTGRGQSVAVWPGGEWHTPLGAVAVDTAFVSRLVKTDPVFALDTTAHMHEHSLEVVLPFLQECRPGLKIVPVAVASPSPEVLARCGAALARCIRDMPEGAVSMVVSTDMSHYVPHEEARRLDHLALAMVRSLDPEGLYETVRAHGISMCGLFPMTAALVACRLLGAVRAELVDYATSGETSGDMDRVVGYAGAIVPAP